MSINEILNQINVQGSIISENKVYLERTDYIVIRNTEHGEDVPQDIKEARDAARAAINAAEQRIIELNNDLEIAQEEEQAEAGQ